MIADVNPDRLCLNCKHWQAILKIDASDDGPVCRLGNGSAGPGDTCREFLPKATFDDMQDPNRFHRKQVLQ